jgi:hypothetical protein
MSLNGKNTIKIFFCFLKKPKVYINYYYYFFKKKRGGSRYDGRGNLLFFEEKESVPCLACCFGC